MKNYAPVNIKERKGEFGTFLSMNFHKEKFIEYLQNCDDLKGYITLTICERKNIGKYGETHNCYENQWRPEGANHDTKPDNNPRPEDDTINKKIIEDDNITDDLPF